MVRARGAHGPLCLRSAFHFAGRSVLPRSATGRKIESRDDGEFKTGRWSSDVPFVVAGFNLGDYETETVGNGHPNVELYANRQLEDAILGRLAASSTSEIPISPEQSTQAGI